MATYITGDNSVFFREIKPREQSQELYVLFKIATLEYLPTVENRM